MHVCTSQLVLPIVFIVHLFNIVFFFFYYPYGLLSEIKYYYFYYYYYNKRLILLATAWGLSDSTVGIILIINLLSASETHLSLLFLKQYSWLQFQKLNNIFYLHRAFLSHQKFQNLKYAHILHVYDLVSFSLGSVIAALFQQVVWSPDVYTAHIALSTLWSTPINLTLSAHI